MDLELTISAEDIDRELAGYATPLIAPFRRPFEKISDLGYGEFEKHMIEAFESALKYTTLSLLAKYKQDGIVDGRLKDSLKAISQPSLGMFSGLLRSLLKTYSHKDSVFVSKITEFYNLRLDENTFVKLQEISNFAEYSTPKNANTMKQLIDVLVIYRNRKIGHGATPQKHEYQKRIPPLVDLVYEFLAKLKFLKECPLIECVESKSDEDGWKYSTRHWYGQGPVDQFLKSPSQLLEKHIYIDISCYSEENSFLDLYPYCLVLFTDREEKADFCFLNKTAKKKIQYLSYQSGAEP